VVGGLIEQQQIGAAHQRLRQIEPHAPTAREIGDRPREIRAREAQACEQRRGARARTVAADLIQARVQFGDPVAAVVRCLCRAQFALGRTQLRVTVEDVLDRRHRQRRRLLRDRCDLPGGRHHAFAEVGVPLAAQHGKEAGLPAAVRAREAHAPARVDLEARILDQPARAAGQREIAELNHFWNRR